jgi:hypothetical protein
VDCVAGCVDCVAGCVDCVGGCVECVAECEEYAAWVFMKVAEMECGCKCEMCGCHYAVLAPGAKCLAGCVKHLAEGVECG